MTWRPEQEIVSNGFDSNSQSLDVNFIFHFVLKHPFCYPKTSKCLISQIMMKITI